MILAVENENFSLWLFRTAIALELVALSIFVGVLVETHRDGKKRKREDNKSPSKPNNPARRFFSIFRKANIKRSSSELKESGLSQSVQLMNKPLNLTRRSRFKKVFDFIIIRLVKSAIVGRICKTFRSWVHKK